MRRLAITIDPVGPIWLGVALIIALFGAFQAYYWIGRKLGERLYDSRIGVKLGRDRIAKVEGVVEKWGAFAVYGCFWVPMLRHTLPWVAGALRVSYPWYVVASALGCLTWAPIWWFGLTTLIWAWLQVAARSPITAAVLAVLFVGGVVGFAVWRRKKRADKALAA
ncbi:DedA family protein [Nonomuraea sp. NEAU-A123]|uniref:DedA family protein n=1 Tax=Nonomuraea sp. NEAU-A123 TaxID=2839649 RepID=UPI001BE47B00|nr:VTT domain-containing protein [Nonomuraea sp. NEAU-A123]MBT2228311.1 VTT domain-containing protein [Nonomuraea sp. NEAU-A123]